MNTFGNITDARKAMAKFDVSSLPADLQDKFLDHVSSPSPVDQIVKAGEFLYANKAKVGAAGRDLAGGLIAFATTNGWHGLLEGDRGNNIVQSLRRDMGDKAPMGQAFMPAHEDPAPLPEFASEVLELETPVPVAVVHEAEAVTL